MGVDVASVYVVVPAELLGVHEGLVASAEEQGGVGVLCVEAVCAVAGAGFNHFGSFRILMRLSRVVSTHWSPGLVVPIPTVQSLLSW